MSDTRNHSRRGETDLLVAGGADGVHRVWTEARRDDDRRDRRSRGCRLCVLSELRIDRRLRHRGVHARLRRLRSLSRVGRRRLRHRLRTREVSDCLRGTHARRCEKQGETGIVSPTLVARLVESRNRRVTRRVTRLTP